MSDQTNVSGQTNLHDKEAIDKLKKLVAEIDVCLFCTNLKADEGQGCRPMSAQKVCDQGNIWFISGIDSDKNRDIQNDPHVRLYFAHPGKSSYVIVNGTAEIRTDKEKIEELWTPVAKAWFKEGKDDPNISVIKVKPTSAYYWDVDGNKMVNFIKMIASAATGTNLVSGKEGTLNV
jgi:general stress protein 26